MGAGAVGCYVGGKLAADGQDVVLVGRERLKREVGEHGLGLTSLSGASVVVPASRVTIETNVATLADRDVVLCCVKSGGTAEAGELLAGVLAPDAIVVSLQNGVRNADELRRKLKQVVLAGIVNFNVLSKGKGVFRRATSGPLIIEASSDPRSTQLDHALVSAGLPVERFHDMVGAQWTKLIINLNNSVSALSGAPTSEILLTPGYRRVLSTVMAEALAVLRAARIRPAKLGALPVHLFPFALRLPGPIVRLVARAQTKIDPEARSSMWEDLMNGRLTEVEYLNGEVVRLAASCGASAPLNARLVEMVHEAERAGAGSPKLTAVALRARLEAR